MIPGRARRCKTHAGSSSHAVRKRDRSRPASVPQTQDCQEVCRERSAIPRWSNRLVLLLHGTREILRVGGVTQSPRRGCPRTVGSYALCDRVVVKKLSQ